MAMRVGVTFGDPKWLPAYEEGVRSAGLEPVRLNEALLDGVSGLLLIGGPDLDPALYHAAPHPEAQPPDHARDRRELAVLTEALARRTPVFGICRGLQLLNVQQGGTLVQHLDSSDVHRQKGRDDAHDIEVAPGTRLAGIIGAGRHTVNSYHHQGIGRLAATLRPSAVAGEVIEAVELPGEDFVLAVQWHPENRFRTREIDLRLFQAFAEAVEKARRV